MNHEDEGCGCLIFLIILVLALLVSSNDISIPVRIVQ